MSATRTCPPVVLMALFCLPGFAGVIDFDDLTTRDSFWALGIAGTYQGYQWGIPGQVPQAGNTGWASATVDQAPESPPPTPVSGSSYAWNFNGPQSLVIVFGAATDVSGAYFATLSSSYLYNASTIQMFGYDAGGVLVASSGVLGLTDTFQYLPAGFSGVYGLEMRANAAGRWFSVDSIVLNQNNGEEIPEPGTAGIVAVGLALTAWLVRGKRA